MDRPISTLASENIEPDIMETNCAFCSVQFYYNRSVEMVALHRWVGVDRLVKQQRQLA